MRKSQVLTRFMLLALISAALAAGAAAVIGTAIAGWAGWLLFAVAVAAIATLAWGAFTPNAPLFGRVVDGHGTPDRVIALTFDDGPSAADDARGARDAARAQGQGDVLRARATRRRASRDRRGDPRRRPRDRLARLRPCAPDVREEGRRHDDARARGDRHHRRLGLGAEPALPRAARLPQSPRAPGGRGARLPRGRLDEGRVGHRQAGDRQDREPLRGGVPARRDPAAARR